MRLWVLGVSVLVHLAALAVLGAFHFGLQADAAGVKPAEISVHAIERVLETPAVIPKPKIEPPPALTVVKSAAPQPSDEKPQEKPTSVPVMPPPAAAPSLFFGAEIAASRVCYVVDGSGSMFGLMYLVRQQLRESILKLSPDQCFNVVFFSNFAG